MLTLDKKRELVRRFFGGTGASYDRVVRIGTLGVDALWKRRILAKIGSPFRLLDLACGTGILTLEIARRHPACEVTGVDITEGYLEVARKKKEGMALRNVRFVRGWAEEFSSKERFDCITSSYLAKYADLPRLVRRGTEMLNPGGLLLFHDFTYPKNRLLAWGWEVHLKLLQRIGSPRFPTWREVFYQLPDLVRRTKWVDELADEMRRNRLVEIRVETLTLQGAALVTARKPS
jgi:demethylmenaquinone methyltransferase/2-methoxy-6-polyprenyl-1,4-benzoquinol methylase